MNRLATNHPASAVQRAPVKGCQGTSVAGAASASNGGKVFWILLIIILPVVGFLIWLVAGPRKGIL